MSLCRNCTGNASSKYSEKFSINVICLRERKNVRPSEPKPSFVKSEKQTYVSSFTNDC